MSKVEQGVKGIIVRDKNFLVLKQVVDGNTFFSLPGGRIESDNQETELKREIKEETGLEVEVKEFVGEWSFSRSNGSVTRLETYKCVPLSEKISHEDTEKYEDIKEVLWLSREEFLEGGYTDNKSLIEVIKKVEI